MSLFRETESKSGSPGKRKKGCWSFQSPSPTGLYFGDRPLSEYLETTDLGWVVELSEYLKGLNWDSFRKAYHPRGRRPLHPRLIVGLVIYGFGQGVSSLRGLEALASRDLGAIYLCGGLRPDHSTIGKFVLRHSGLLQADLFHQTLSDIADYFELGFDEISGDGTVIEAFGSRFRGLEKEALEAALGRALSRKGHDSEAEMLSRAYQELSERERQKASSGKRGKTKIHPGEVEAVFQPLKNKTCRFSYKPLILSCRHRFIVSHGVDPSGESRGMEKLLDKFIGSLVPGHFRLMLDAGFLTEQILKFSLSHKLDLLIPTGCAERGFWNRRRNNAGKYDKTDFIYDDEADRYLCPSGHGLDLESVYHDRSRLVKRYHCRDSKECGHKSRCTKAARGRSVKRYEYDDLKEAMRQVMSQPRAQARYRKRAGMVEPIFGLLRYGQNLQRFHRRGLDGVRLEFGLHVLAYNLGRAFRVMGMLVGCKMDPKTGARVYFYLFFSCQWRKPAKRSL